MTKQQVESRRFYLKHRVKILELKKSYYQRHRERIKATMRDKYSAEKNHASKIKRYGISASDYKKLLAKQHGKCAICQSKQGASDGRRLAVDHDHITNSVRGLLCGNCNNMLGRAKDSTKILMEAISYLQGIGR